VRITLRSPAGGLLKGARKRDRCCS
jgi:hypothetical protein